MARVATIAAVIAGVACQATPPPRDSGARDGAVRDGGTQAKVVFQVATRIPRPPLAKGEEPRQPSIAMGEGWACAAFETGRGTIHQCWEAGPRPRAFTVPWMKDHRHIARDRWCEVDPEDQSFRCWRRPRRGDTGPHPLSSDWQWMNPFTAEGKATRRNHLDDILMGGTFACLSTRSSQGIFCRGDNHYGQLGTIPRPARRTLPGDLPIVRGLKHDVQPALGIWHACALADPGDQDEVGSVPVLCWGRGDVGQLGAPGPHRCMVDGNLVPCARTPVASLRVSTELAVLGVGDLFSCVSSMRGTQCWGANRDGLIGVRGSCPESLRQAWPTPNGPVPAPNASCTTKPVTLPGGKEFDQDLEVAPREIRYQGRILSPIPEPRDPSLGRAWVSPSSDASWCAARRDGVVCWGERYSPPGALSKPVPVVFDPLPPLGELAVIDGPPVAPGKTNCQIHRTCRHLVPPLPPCEDDKVSTVPDVLSKAESLLGTVVRVRGRLGIGTLKAPNDFSTFHHNRCDPVVGCCQSLGALALIGGPDGAIALAGHGCEGDESRVCCNIPAHGQPIVATGTLKRQSEDANTVGWKLVDARLCEAHTSDSN